MSDKSWKPSLTKIDDPIATDVWEYRSDGIVVRTLIEVGRPTRIDNDDATSEWYCPLRIEGWFEEEVRVVVGLGSVDALMNAMSLVKKFFEETHRFARSEHD